MHRVKRHVLLPYIVKKSIGQPGNLGHSEEPSLGPDSAIDRLCDLGQVTSVLCFFYL